MEGLPQAAQTGVSTLIDNAGKKLTGDELAELNDIPNGRLGIAGVLAWPDRNLVPLGRHLPINAEPAPEGGGLYSIGP